jgi:hypothetical protein
MSSRRGTAEEDPFGPFVSRDSAATRIKSFHRSPSLTVSGSTPGSSPIGSATIGCDLSMSPTKGERSLRLLIWMEEVRCQVGQGGQRRLQTRQ